METAMEIIGACILIGSFVFAFVDHFKEWRDGKLNKENHWGIW